MTSNPDDATLMAMYEATEAGPRRMLRFARALLASFGADSARIDALSKAAMWPLEIDEFGPGLAINGDPLPCFISFHDVADADGERTILRYSGWSIREAIDRMVARQSDEWPRRKPDLQETKLQVRGNQYERRVRYGQVYWWDKASNTRFSSTQHEAALNEIVDLRAELEKARERNNALILRSAPIALPTPDRP